VKNSQKANPQNSNKRNNIKTLLAEQKLHLPAGNLLLYCTAF